MGQKAHVTKWEGVMQRSYVLWSSPHLSHQWECEDRHVAQDMNGDGNHQTPLYLIGHSKDNPSHNLRSEYSFIRHGVGCYKQKGAQSHGQYHTPSFEKAIEYTPEKDLFSYGPQYSTNKEEKYENELLILSYLFSPWSVPIQRILSLSSYMPQTMLLLKLVVSFDICL